MFSKFIQEIIKGVCYIQGIIQLFYFFQGVFYLGLILIFVYIDNVNIFCFLSDLDRFRYNVCQKFNNMGLWEEEVLEVRIGLDLEVINRFGYRVLMLLRYCKSLMDSC